VHSSQAESDPIYTKNQTHAPLKNLDPDGLVQIWNNHSFALLCAVYLLFSLIQPVDGLPIRFCLFHFLFGIDCPSCGMTRALSHLWRGEWSESFAQHPFGIPAMVVLLFSSSSLILRGKIRDSVESFLFRWTRFFKLLGWVLVGAILVFGILRALGQILGLV